MELIPFDPAEHLETDEDILDYLEAALEGDNAKHIADATKDVVRALRRMLHR